MADVQLNDGIDLEADGIKDNPLAIKAISDDEFRGYAILWGHKYKKDIQGEYFKKGTVKGLYDVFEITEGSPWIMEHGAEKAVRGKAIAVIDEFGEDDVGVYYKAKVKQHDLYRKYVKHLVDTGKLYSSSGAFPYTKSVTPSGQVVNWTIAEVSGTVKPVDHHQLEEGQIESVKGFMGDEAFNKYYEAVKAVNMASAVDEVIADNEVTGTVDPNKSWERYLEKEQKRAAIDIIQNQLNIERDRLRILSLSQDISIARARHNN